MIQYSFVFYFLSLFELSESTEVCLHSGETFSESLTGRSLHIQVDGFAPQFNHSVNLFMFLNSVGTL